MSKRAAFVIFLLTCVLSFTMAAQAQTGLVDVYGRSLPADAAPYEFQVWQELCSSSRRETALMSSVSVYERICDLHGYDQLGDPLVTFDSNLNLIPGAAERWEVSADGLSWTFYLRPGQMWSDGTPLTMYDYLATYRYMADPDSDYDFAWAWSGIVQGWDQAVLRRLRPEEISIIVLNDLSMRVRAVAPTPILPALFSFWAPMQAAALERYGSPAYLLNPETSVSSGPFVLREYVPGQRLVLQANPTYTGFRRPYLREIRGIYGNQITGSFLAFQNGDVDRVHDTALLPTDMPVIAGTPALANQLRTQSGNFSTDLLVFDITTPPFDNFNVRLAFARALDRELVTNAVYGTRLPMAEQSFLVPGFPVPTGDADSVQVYECSTARSLLSAAGYPNGDNFPPLEVRLSGRSELTEQLIVAAVNSISNCLNVQITVNSLDEPAFMRGFFAQRAAAPLSAVSLDYLDPANPIGLWQAARHLSWAEADLLDASGRIVGDASIRSQLYAEASRLLNEDVTALLIATHPARDLFQPYVAGECLTPNALGVSAFAWGNVGCWGSLYITNGVLERGTYRTR